MAQKNNAKLLNATAVTDNLMHQFAQNQMFIDGFCPTGLLQPGTAEELEQIVRSARDEKTPLVLVSSTGEHYHGGATPVTEGTVMLDLSKMNSIRSINRQHRMAVVEAGVTYEQLQPELAKHDLQLPFALAPKSGKSVVASLLDPEPRLCPMRQWNYMDPLRCVEVVWGDGNRMTTGDAASGGVLDKQWEKGNWQICSGGPMMIDYYRLVSGSQGTMGAVTWASIRCDILPKLHGLYIVATNDMNQAIDFMYALVHKRFGDELLLVDRNCFASLTGLDEKASAKLPEWLVLVGIAGRDICFEERYQAQFLDIGDIAKSFGLELRNEIGGMNGDRIFEIITTPCKPDAYWKKRGKSAFGDIFFMTTLDRTPQFVKLMRAEARKLGFFGRGVDVYIQPVHQGVSCQCEFVFAYDAEATDETLRAEALFRMASKALANAGVFFARPYGDWAKLQIARDEMTEFTLSELKKIFDPECIMNPGKLLAGR